jgi:hypothetical protein
MTYLKSDQYKGGKWQWCGVWDNNNKGGNIDLIKRGLLNEFTSLTVCIGRRCLGGPNPCYDGDKRWKNEGLSKSEPLQ